MLWPFLLPRSVSFRRRFIALLLTTTVLSVFSLVLRPTQRALLSRRELLLSNSAFSSSADFSAAYTQLYRDVEQLAIRIASPESMRCYFAFTVLEYSRLLLSAEESVD